jgi:hypothetical protein
MDYLIGCLMEWMEMDARAFHPRPSIHCQEMVEWMTTLLGAL